jgi:hypothetical protein
MEEEKKSLFDELSKVDLSDKIKKKLGLSYVSWAWAWTEVKKRYPNAFYTIYSRTINTERVFEKDGVKLTETTTDEVNYFTDYKTCWVKVGVTIEGIEQIQQLAIMDLHNKAISYDDVTSVDVNKAIQRCLVKAIAMHGLGLYIYAGEDLPESDPVILSKEKAENAANEIKEIPITEKDKFEQHKAHLISLVRLLSINKDANALTVEYISTILPNQKLSELTDKKYLEILKAEAYLDNINKQANG